MKLLKYATAIGLAGALAVAATSPSQARNGRWVGPAVGGFVAGAAIGAAAASANNGYYYDRGYYEPGYAYEPGYDSYAYDPGYRSYRSWSRNSGPNREDSLTQSSQ